jgi:hypothetical protein
VRRGRCAGQQPPPSGPPPSCQLPPAARPGWRGWGAESWGRHSGCWCYLLSQMWGTGIWGQERFGGWLSGCEEPPVCQACFMLAAQFAAPCMVGQDNVAGGNDAASVRRHLATAHTPGHTRTPGAFQTSISLSIHRTLPHKSQKSYWASSGVTAPPKCMGGFGWHVACAAVVKEGGPAGRPAAPEHWAAPPPSAPSPTQTAGRLRHRTCPRPPLQLHLCRQGDIARSGGSLQRMLLDRGALMQPLLHGCP